MADGNSGQVPVFKSVGEGYTYLLQNWSRWLPAAVVFGAVAGALAAAFPNVMTSLQDIFPPNQSLMLNPIVALLQIFIGVGIYKHALLDEYASPIGVSAGMPELRVLGVIAGLNLIFSILLIFFALIMFIILGGAAAQMGLDLENAEPKNVEQIADQLMQSGGATIVLVSAIILFVASIFISVRLSFVQAATVAEKRMMAFSTWGLTEGNWWRVLACILMVIVPVGMVAGILTSLVVLVFLDAGSLGTSFQRYMFGQGIGVITIMSQVPLIGLMAYLYKGLRPRESVNDVFS